MTKLYKNGFTSEEISLNNINDIGKQVATNTITIVRLDERMDINTNSINRIENKIDKIGAKIDSIIVKVIFLLLSAVGVMLLTMLTKR